MARSAVKRGLRLSVGSWNTIWMRRRKGERANCLAGHGADIRAVEDGCVPLRRIDQPRDHHRGRRLAAAGFADEPERLAARDGEADAVDGAERRGFRRLGLAHQLRRASPTPPARGYSLTRFSTRSSGVAQRGDRRRRRLAPRPQRGGCSARPAGGRRASCRCAASPASACGCRGAADARKIVGGVGASRRPCPSPSPRPGRNRRRRGRDRG